MILPYEVRLAFLCLATFFLTHLFLGLAVWLVTPAALRRAANLHPQMAARLLLGLRLLPPVGSVVLVAGLCLPSFLWLEAETGEEQVGIVFLVTALSGAALWGISAERGLRAMARSSRYLKKSLRTGRKKQIAGESSPVWVVEDASGRLVLAGILRTKIIVSPPVIRALTSRQLSAAVRHENAHGRSADNLKRLVLLLAPDVLPFWRNFERLERGWAKFSEWAADDWAVGGDAGRSLSLAAALVRVARLGPGPRVTPLVTCLVEDQAELSARVGRLLCMMPAREESPSATLLTVGACAGLMAAGVAVMLRPGTLQTAHHWFERLIQ